MVHSLKPEIYRAELRIRGDFKGEGRGEIRGIPLIGRSEMVLEAEPAKVNYDVLIASCTSIVSVIISFYGRSGSGALTLLEILGPGKLSGEAVYRVFNENMKLVGEVGQKFEAEIKVSENGKTALTTAETIIEGTCWGDECRPGMMRTCPGYVVYLRQADDETIEGNYSQIIYLDQGKIYVTVKRIYQKKNIAIKMPFDELIIYRILCLQRSRSASRESVSWIHETMALPADPDRITMV